MLNKSAVKYFTLITSIIAFIIGLVVINMPLASSVVVNYIIVVSMGLIGISKICMYVSVKEKNVWDLILGILYLIVCLLLLSNGALVVEYTAGYMLAFMAIVSGICQFFLAPKASKIFGDSKAWYIVSGIVEIIIGLCIACIPVATQIIGFWIFGVFLIAYAIIAFIQGLTIKVKK